MTTAQFHLAFPVRSLEEARIFYLEAIGCTMGREDQNHLDFNMFGHHVVAHIAPEQNALGRSQFDGHEVPIPHFGLNLEADAWAELAARLKRNRANFREYPHVRMAGQVGEHDTMFVYDPSGNALEFKSFRDPLHVFTIDPNQPHTTPDERTVIRPMIEAEVFRTCGAVQEDLVAAGLLDSLKAFELVASLKRAFRIELDDVTMQDLSSITSIVETIYHQAKRKEAR
jgi:uncharacterized protein